MHDTTCVTIKSDKTNFIGTHCSTICWETVGVQFFGPSCIIMLLQDTDSKILAMAICRCRPISFGDRDLCLREIT